MPPQIKYGYTYYSTYSGIVGLRVFKPQFITVQDHDALGLSSPKVGEWVVEYQPYKDPHKYHTLNESYIRDVSAYDFEVGDIIMENSLAMFDAEIIEIKTQQGVSQRGALSDPPIVAEQLDTDGTKTGNIFHLEPYECIMVNKLNDDTLDLKLGTIQAPKNNQKRETCFWCRGKTERVEGFTDIYDICPKCKR
jgi:hypothetical protein